MQIPPYIWKLKGSMPGPVVTILGGTHGDGEEIRSQEDAILLFPKPLHKKS